MSTSLSSQPLKNSPSSDKSSTATVAHKHPVRRLLFFQLKLAVDALRDILLSPVSVVCSLVDMLEKRHGPDSHFEKLMAFGRNTEKRINLFEQHQGSNASIDTILGQVEELFVNEYKDKKLAKKTIAKLERLIAKEREKQNNTKI
jgi:hypothetical protein